MLLLPVDMVIVEGLGRWLEEGEKARFGSVFELLDDLSRGCDEWELPAISFAVGPVIPPGALPEEVDWVRPSSPICALLSGQLCNSSSSSARASKARESVGGALGDVTLVGGEVEAAEREDGCWTAEGASELEYW